MPEQRKGKPPISLIALAARQCYQAKVWDRGLLARCNGKAAQWAAIPGAQPPSKLLEIVSKPNDQETGR